MRFKDRRGRCWERLIKPSFYDMFWIRCISLHPDVRNLLAFRFISKKDADMFVKLIERSR